MACSGQAPDGAASRTGPLRPEAGCCVLCARLRDQLGVGDSVGGYRPHRVRRRRVADAFPEPARPDARRVRRDRLDGGPSRRWWLAVLSPLAFFFGVIGVMAAAGADLPTRNDFARISGLPAGIGIVGVALLVTVVNGFGEETGWRGYALPQLQRRFGPLAASLIIAVFWAAWHIPQFFFLNSYKNFSVAMLPVFVLGLACGAIVWTWIYNHTGSILAVAVWHGIYNVTGGTKAAADGRGTIAAAMWTYVVLNAIVLLVLERRARRAGRPSILAAR